MKRAIAFAIALAFVAGCSGVGGGSNHFIPGAPSDGMLGAANGAAALSGNRHHRMAKVSFTMRIPHRHRHDRMLRHPATISPLTQSVSISVNGGAPVVFNATPASPGCSIVSGNTICTFAMNAPIGSDTFVVSTYTALSAGGTVLDHGTAVIPVVRGKANTALITLGPIVSTTADSGVGSLRYAIANANAGDSIMFMLPAASTITVGSPLTLPVSLSITGPGVTTSARRRSGRHGDLIASGVTISGGLAQQIFIVNSGITATIAGVILSGGLAGTVNRPGGAIYNAGTLTLSNDGFTANNSHVSSPYVRVAPHVEHARHHHSRPALASANGLHPHCLGATYYGGAVYNHGSLSVSGSTFDSNVLQNDSACSNWSYGAAIYNDQYGTLVSSGNAYSNNSAYQGAAVFNNSKFGQASFTGDTFTGNLGCTASTGCAVSGCGVGPGNGCTTYPVGFGAAIYDNDGPGVTIASSAFTNNVVGGVATNSTGEGGAVYLGTGSPSITGSAFTGNLAGGGTSNCSFGEGGAIYEDAANVLELDNDTFTSNSAGGDGSGYGGAIYNNSNADHGSGNTFTSNLAFATAGGTGCAPTDQASGGAIYADDGISMSSSTFNSNSASATYDAYGGALYEDSSSTLTSNSFSSNTASATGLNSASLAQAYGGALYSDAVMRMTGNTFTGNSVTALTAVGQIAEGGAVYAFSTLTTNGDTFTSNSVSIPAGTGTEHVYGGALYTHSSLASSGDTFSSNSASGSTPVYGGALSIDGTYNLTGGTFTSNTATASAGSANGGAVDLESAGTLSNSTFTSNSALSTGATHAWAQGGGAIYDGSGSTLNGLTMTGNSATGAGGAVYVESHVDQINASTLSGNTVLAAGDYGGGGAIYGLDGFEVANSTLSANTVAVTGNYAGGGALYVDSSGGSVTGSTISGNSVTGTGTHSGGGGIFSYDSGLYTNDTITGNSSSKDGGGFEEYSNYNVRFTNVTMYHNTASEYGGNIFNDNASSPYVHFGGSIIAGGSASAGGPDIYNSGQVDSNGYNIIGAGVDGGGTFGAGTGDQIGTNLSPLNPQLIALSNNGGPTFTMADTPTSPGVGKIPVSGGSCNGTGITVDQRGFMRGTSFCDIGAYELNGLATAIRSHPIHGFPGVCKHPQRQHHQVIPPQER
jgi:hypothetical protein